MPFVPGGGSKCWKDGGGKEGARQSLLLFTGKNEQGRQGLAQTWNPTNGEVETGGQPALDNTERQSRKTKREKNEPSCVLWTCELDTPYTSIKTLKRIKESTGIQTLVKK